MRLIDALRRAIRRTDVRSAAVIASTLLLGIALQNGILFAFVSMEALEEADGWVEHGLRSLARDVEAGRDPGETLAEIEHALGSTRGGARLSRGGVVVASWGEWPEEEATSAAREGEDARRLTDLGTLGPERYLSGSRRLSDGSLLTLAVPLRHFAAEADEVGWGLVLVSSISAALALLVAVGATFWAFKPLRATTALLAGVGARRLGGRLPTRGTNDAVDRHAQLLNRVLSDIDGSLLRLHAFSSDVAHELRTPLNRIATVADVAIDGSPEEARRALGSVRATTVELSRVVDALLLIAELDDRQQPLSVEPIDAGQRIREAATLYAPSFEDRKSPIELDVSNSPLHVMPELFDRILFNLLENALEHTAAGVRVVVACHSTEDVVTISVDDSGEGIDDDRLEAVFDRFGGSRASDRQGHGLGLAITRAIVRLHGGEVWAERSPLGGARFVCRLPRLASSSGREPPA